MTAKRYEPVASQDQPASGRPPQRHQEFQRDLTAPTLTLLTVGGVMGSGLFMASGLAIRQAGPSVLWLYVLGALAMSWEIRALAELSIAVPSPGSFLVVTRTVLGPAWLFVAGWIFWFSSVLTMSSEVTAAALFTRYWFPEIALWIWSLSYSVLIVAINFVSVRGFGAIEDVMAGVKALAVLAFIAVGGLALLGGLGLRRRLPANALHLALFRSGWLPHGWLGAAPALLLVLFAYAGTGVIGLAAAETQAPTVTLPKSVRQTTALVVVMYLGSIFMILSLVPWNRQTDTVSPFVSALHAISLPFAPFVMNVVLLFAVLSTMNAALYANVRVLYSLAKQGEAPKILGRLNGKGLPANATWASAGLLALTILLAYVLPNKAYAYLVTATGFQAMFIWFVILLTQLRYRRHVAAHTNQTLGYKLWGSPFTTWFVMAVVVLALVLSPLAQGELFGAIIGSGGILAAWLIWWLVRRRRPDDPAPTIPPAPQADGARR
ncbi:MAG: amino acid permease [Thermaerobacter sp.]|nr:amino acid permease [Thermaerobacter sp.]